MEEYSSAEAYLAALNGRAQCPRGFRFAAGNLTFFPKERPVRQPLPMKLSLIVADRPTDAFAAVLTRNAFPGAPILLARERLAGTRLQGILINNKISNVGSPTGLKDAKELCNALGRRLGTSAEYLLSVSTGIIGWSLPVNDMAAVLPTLVERLGQDNPVDLARAIMTTDRYPKMRTTSLGKGTIMAVAKGAGMIEPNLATMLVFIVTDIDLDRVVLDRALRTAVEATFNCISVDSDQSTSDMCVLMSSRQTPAVPEDEFTTALTGLCAELAQDIVRNGEGTRHVIRVQVEGFGSECRNVGKAVVNSPLVKTAVYGNDPNVGRLVASIGDYLGNQGLALDPGRLEISLWDIPVFAEGAFRLDQDKEVLLSDRLLEASQDPAKGAYPEHNRTVDVQVRQLGGTGEAIVLGSDLGYEYVRENADYRS